MSHNKIGLRAPEILRRDHGLNPSDLRRKAEADPNGYAHTVRALVAGSSALASGLQLPAELREAGVSEQDARAFSLRQISPERFKALRSALDFEVSIPESHGSQRSVTTGAFPLLTSALAVAGVNEAYTDVPTIGQNLVEEVDDNKRESVFAGILNYKKEDVVRKSETEPYAQISSGEEQFHIGALDLGLQVVITQRLIDEADTVGMVERLTNLGRFAANELEEHTLRRVTDNAGSAAAPVAPFALHGPRTATGAAFFRASNAAPFGRLPANGNRVTSNPLADLTNLETARARFAEFTDASGYRIAFDPSELVMLVPDALRLRAWTLLNSAGSPGVFNEANFFGPDGEVRPGLLSSPKLDALSPSAWYWGTPRRVFVRRWKLRPEIATHGGNGTLPYASTREALRVRIAWECEIGARDYVGWLQCLAGTTAPTNAGGY